MDIVKDDFYNAYVDLLEQPIDWWDREVEPLGEMLTIGSQQKPQLRVQVNPDRGRKGSPYFKVFNTDELKTKQTRVARLSFLSTKIIYHRDEFRDWNITKKDIINIHNFMNSENKNYPGYTNWQITKWKWNYEYFGFNDEKFTDYMTGELDDKYKNHPSYVPSTTEIPETWE